MNEWASGSALSTESWKEHWPRGNNNYKIHIIYKTVIFESYGDV